MSHSAILVFTARSPNRILAEGGSQAWVLDRRRARQAEYLVCAQNTQTNWGDATEPHGTAFLVGRVADVIRSPEDEDRWLIRISEYAQIDLPDAWQGWRNPVRYTTLEEIGIDPATLTFKPIPEMSEDPVSADDAGVKPLTIAEAKAGLAAQFSVSVDAIEITIRG